MSNEKTRLEEDEGNLGIKRRIEMGQKRLFNW